MRRISSIILIVMVIPFYWLAMNIFEALHKPTVSKDGDTSQPISQPDGSAELMSSLTVWGVPVLAILLLFVVWWVAICRLPNSRNNKPTKTKLAGPELQPPVATSESLFLSFAIMAFLWISVFTVVAILGYEMVFHYDSVFITISEFTYTPRPPNPEFNNPNPDFKSLQRTGKHVLDLYYIMLVPAFIGSALFLHFLRTYIKRWRCREVKNHRIQPNI